MSAATDTVLRQRVLKEKVKTRESADSSITYVRPNVFEAIPKTGYSAKRVLDLMIGALALTGFFILYPFIAAGIKLTSKGPVLFKQPRTGKNGNIFFCYKFRTMHVVQKKAENGLPVVTQKGDNRIFSFGQFLRKTNLDELPQILNVMKGEMSLVGPRPYPVDECAYWNRAFDDHYYRYILKPGITGFAQAQGYRGGTLDVELMRKRLDFDLIYIEKTSFSFDMKIIYKTVKRMVVRDTNGH
ncbi:sugar transferase [Rhodohalobacter sp. 8-1]|uniref:sugar transferase n=1 Tax=Rhodohalobacter sp. 8-1 TaxID=3131972 RepID=UPI0030ED7D86